MANKRSKEVRARMSAAAKKRWANKRGLKPVRICPSKSHLIFRMTQAIDKIETQIKRLESL